MTIDNLLSRLQNVKRTGPGQWIASCPTRDDKHPSMTIKELDDGRILIHDFGGDSPQEILDALNLTFSDLFPDKITDHGKPVRPRFPAIDILRCISFEALLVAISACNIAKGMQLTDGDKKRLMMAAGRINAAMEVTNGYR